MHLTRKESTIKLPIVRKGTKYLVRPKSHTESSVAVLVALRDMLHLARTMREVQGMIKQGTLKINGKVVRDYHESIKLFNIFEADKSYELTFLPSGKFTLIPHSKKPTARLCKVTNKRLVSKGIYQINFHDGTNIQTKEKINVFDSAHISFEGKMTKHMPLQKSAKVMIIKGKYLGQEGTIQDIAQVHVQVKIKDATHTLPKQNIIVQ